MNNPATSKRRNYDVLLLPLDLVFQILIRLSAQTVARFQLVSKSWAEIIRSKSFIRSFPLRSSTEPSRLLIASNVKDSQSRKRSLCFFSSSPLSSSSTSVSTSVLSSIKYTPRKNPRAEYIYYVNGLMLIGGFIVNPCTGKSITLPNIITLRSTQVRRFFGYDPVNDEYKVLRMTLKLKARLARDVWSDFQVFTLGEESWRRIDCNVPHCPISKGLCIDGAVYYIADTDTDTGTSLMRFDLKSEKFDIYATVSEDLGDRIPTLINYHGKVAAAIRPHDCKSTIDLFVFEAGKQEFRERSFCNLPEWGLSMKCIDLYTGEIIFERSCYHYEPGLIYYDLEGDSCKKIMIEVDASFDGKLFSQGNYFVGYVESLMLL